MFGLQPWRLVELGDRILQALFRGHLCVMLSFLLVDFKHTGKTKSKLKGTRRLPLCSPEAQSYIAKAAMSGPHIESNLGIVEK